MTVVNVSQTRSPVTRGSYTHEFATLAHGLLLIYVVAQLWGIDEW